MFSFFSQQNIIIQATGIEIKPSDIHGRGVFACAAFTRGAIIEIAPLILLSAEDRAQLQETALYNYYFVVNNAETPAALGLGFSSVYNHSRHANAVYAVSLKKATLTITARRDIQAGEEITINYNGVPEDTSPVFFETQTA